MLFTIVYSSILAILIITSLIAFYFSTPQLKLIMSKRIKNLNYKSIIKMYLSLIGFFLSLGNDLFEWLNIIILSIVVTSILVFYAVIGRNFTDSEREVYYDKEIKKSIERESKINSILKKSIF